jgi:nucleotide-binding universal stress UspA family protein
MPTVKRILAATDLSAPGERAVMRAAQLARQWEATLHIVHARPDWNLYARWRPASADAYQQIARRADHLLAELHAKITGEFNLKPRWDSRLGRASDVVTAMVAEHDPHLIVIGAVGEHAGTHNNSLVNSLAASNLGGTALKLARRFTQPLLLVRGEKPTVYTRSIVAVDSASPLARRALLWGSTLVRDGETHLVLAYDIPYLERMPSAATSATQNEALLKQAAEGARATLAELKGVAATGTLLESHAVRGEPVAVVLGEIINHGAQLIVMGNRSLQSTLVLPGGLGTVAFRIADQAPIDVLILS